MTNYSCAPLWPTSINHWEKALHCVVWPTPMSLRWSKFNFAYQIPPRLGRSFRSFYTKPKTGWWSSRNPQNMATVADFDAIFIDNVPSRLDSSQCYGWCYGLAIPSRNRWCSHIPRRVFNLVSVSHLTWRCSVAMAVARWWHAEAHCGLGTSCAICIILLHCHPLALHTWSNRMSSSHRQ